MILRWVYTAFICHPIQVANVCNSRQGFNVVCICTTKYFPDVGDTKTLQMDFCSELMWLVPTKGFSTVHIQFSSPKWITLRKTNCWLLNKTLHLKSTKPIFRLYVRVINFKSYLQNFGLLGNLYSYKLSVQFLLELLFILALIFLHNSG
jgi:hypothetical protein